MVIVAHPDDADFGPAATAARWIDDGSEGWLVCCTSGDAGADDWRTDPLELAALREAEQRAAAAIVGYAGVSFLHQPDGALANDLALREQLVREIRTFRPDAVLAVDPETLFYDDGRRQPRRPSGRGDGGRRRRLPGRAQRDGVPVARPRRPRAAHGPPPVPVLVGPAVGVGRRHRDDRSQDRGAARPRRARSGTPSELEPRIRDWAQRGGGGDRRRGRRGAAGDRDRADEEPDDAPAGPPQTDDAEG